ncbi:alpha/beta hydrolase [Pseudonocardia sp. KRD291]|uniref:alpha/beta hydrolase n=1 Tax=Pseudonocardia sp. KRD291 TaxID=2792007 RepID=UPI001C4A14D5|nr:alpha/beta hydrolase [Pseudonocardia sp. KRD291]MBW0102743.1 alpha/beta hydrolase [Pseudonocardia sp. KRD291]
MTAPLPRPPFDAELETALAAVHRVVPPGITPDLIEQVRRARDASSPSLREIVAGRAIDVSEHVVPGPGGEVPVSVVRPRDQVSGAPVVYWCHGGGMFMGDRATGAAQFCDWVEQLGVVVVSVEYRLAPEHPDPAPVEDCYAGLVWTAQNAAGFSADASSLVVGGASAGGGLAAGVALLARDRGGPAIAGQLLVYPMLDDRNDTGSTLQFEGVGVWDRISNRTGWDALLGGRRGTADVSPYAAPARARDLSGLPPAYVDVASTETFRDEDVAYATALWNAGVQAELHVWPGGFHGFDGFVPDADLSRRARAARVAWLTRRLGLSVPA